VWRRNNRLAGRQEPARGTQETGIDRLIGDASEIGVVKKRTINIDSAVGREVAIGPERAIGTVVAIGTEIEIGSEEPVTGKKTELATEQLASDPGREMTLYRKNN
jgi:hypothetical protein